MAMTLQVFTRRRATASLALLSALLLAGCGAQKAWVYGPEEPTSGKPLVDKSVVVMPFVDRRSHENSDKLAMYVIPLLPYGWQELNTPEGFSRHTNSWLWLWKPPEDMAKATADELNNAQIFREVYFGSRGSEGDLVLKGIIKSSKYDGKFISYGLSVFGPVLWLVGFPATYVSNELILSFKLEDRKNNRTLWEREYREAMDKTSWMYYLRSDFEYADMLKKILLRAMDDMKADAYSIRSKLQETERGAQPGKL